MALGRVKSWNDGEVLFAADQNAEFNNILNNPIALISPPRGAINFNLQAHTGLLPGAVTGTSGSTGQMVGVLQSGTVGFINVGSAVSRVSGLVGTLSSQSGTFAADGYQMRSSSNLSWYVSATSAYSASVGSAGPAAGGRDVAGVFASTEVHWYAISTGPGSTAPAGLVSSQRPPTGPVLPAGYAGWTYLGASPYTSASTTVAHASAFRGSQAYFDARVSLITAVSTDISTGLVGTIPTNASRVLFHADFANTASTISVVGIGPVAGSNIAAMVNSSAAGARQTEQFMLPNSTAVFLTFSVSTAGRINELSAVGYTMPNGDV